MCENRRYTNNAIYELHGIVSRKPAFSALNLTPEEWLDLLPAIVAQLEPQEHEDFVIRTLREFDRYGAEIGGCLADERY